VARSRSTTTMRMARQCRRDQSTSAPANNPRAAADRRHAQRTIVGTSAVRRGIWRRGQRVARRTTRERCDVGERGGELRAPIAPPALPAAFGACQWSGGPRRFDRGWPETGAGGSARPSHTLCHRLSHRLRYRVCLITTGAGLLRRKAGAEADHQPPRRPGRAIRRAAFPPARRESSTTTVAYGARPRARGHLLSLRSRSARARSITRRPEECSTQ